MTSRIIKRTIGEIRAGLSFKGATAGAIILHLPYYIRTGTTPWKGFQTWLKVMWAYTRTTKLPWQE